MRPIFRRQGMTGGSATVEFAIIAPVLILATLSMADIGLAIHESFEIDQAVRNGAQVALGDPGKAEVEAVLAAVDRASGNPSDTEWSVDRFCACPESPDTPTGCPTTCNGARPTSIFYDIRGVRSFPGILLPSRDLTRSAAVQVR